MQTSEKQSPRIEKLNGAITDYFAAASFSEAAAHSHLLGSGAIAELEKKIADHYGMKYALCVSNATSGLFATALALGLKDTEFITSPYTYGGTLASWLMLGCNPVFADIDPITLTLDAEKVRHCLTSETKAVLSADIFGIPSDTHALRKLADQFGLWYVADCAQSFGATRRGFPANCLADVLVVSFGSMKILSAGGEGGAICTSNRAIYEKLLFYSQHPLRQKRELGLGIYNEFAFNCRIHPLAAICANVQFESSLHELKWKQSDCFRVIEFLNENSLTTPINFAERNILPSFFRLTAEPKRGKTETKLITYLAERGIRATTSPNPVSLIYRQPAFIACYEKQFRLPAPCRVAERQAERRIVINLLKQ